MYRNLDAIPWSELEHAFGPADEIPVLLETMTDTSVAQLKELLVHQGGALYSAAPPALPFLVQALVDGPPVVRGPVADLICRLAEAAHDSGDRTPAHVQWQWATEWMSGWEAITRVLGGNDAFVRARIAAALSWPPVGAAAAVAVLRQRWSLETDIGVRLQLILALARSACGARPVDAETRNWLQALLEDPHPAVRLAASVALADDNFGVDAERRGHAILRSVDGLHSDGWELVYLAPRRVAALVRWLDGSLKVALAPRLTLAAELLSSASEQTRVGAGRSCIAIYGDFRSPASDLALRGAGLVADPQPELRTIGLYILAMAADVSAPYVDELIQAAHSSDETVAKYGLWALARQRHPACVPGLVSRLGQQSTGYPTLGSGWGDEGPDLPAIVDILTPLAAYADELVAPVSQRLLAATNAAEIAAYTMVLRKWGAAARSASPALSELARRSDAVPVLEALVAVDPSADILPAAAARLVRRSDAQPLDRARASLARWQATGEVDNAISLIGALLDSERTAVPAAELAAAMGHAAASLTERIRPMLHRGEEWYVATGAWTLWRLTGDAQDSCRSVAPLVMSLEREYQATPPMLTALKCLRHAGPVPDLLRGALRHVGQSDRRFGFGAGWRKVDFDDELRKAAMDLLALHP